MGGGTYFDDGIEQSGGTDDLFDHDTFGAYQLVVGGGGTDIDDLTGEGFELVEGEGAVVTGGRQTETIFDQVLLTGTVSSIHGPYLGYTDVAFVDDDEIVLGEKVEQAVRTGTFGTAIEVA